MNSKEFVCYTINGVPMNNVVLTDERVVRCERCKKNSDCVTRTTLSDPHKGFCSDGEEQ